MVPLPVVRPLGSPSCWGQKYQDGDVECDQCKFNDTCKKEVLRGSMSSPMTGYVPLPRTPAWQSPQQSNIPVSRPVPAPPPYPMQYQQPAPVQPLYPQPPSYQPAPAQQYSQQHPYLPMDIPDPLQPWARPGVVSPPYYFNQYPGEHVVERFAKNILLRAIAAIGQEFLSFFIQWTWPPSRSNNKQG